MKGLAHFGRALRENPPRAMARLCVEYSGYFAAWGFVAFLVATRRPLRAIDRRFGLRLRERVIDAIARVSPG